MTNTQIDYDKKVQDALRQVVRSILAEVAEKGPIGEHHFYITFKTQASGVAIPEHLKARFPEEMTIVLQHKFWDLRLEEDAFFVTLTFNQKPETLCIPFATITGFVDPSVQFALQFDDGENFDLDDFSEDVSEYENNLSDFPSFQTGNANKNQKEPASGKIDKIGKARKRPKADPADKDDPTNQASKAPPSGGAEIVTLDAFRKK